MTNNGGNAESRRTVRDCNHRGFSMFVSSAKSCNPDTRHYFTVHLRASLLWRRGAVKACLVANIYCGPNSSQMYIRSLNYYQAGATGPLISGRDVK